MHSEMLKGPWITFHLLNLQFLYIWTGSVIYPDMQRIIYINLILICIFPGIFSQDKALFRKTFLDAEFFFMTEEYQEALHLYTELLKTDPDNSNLHFLAGACYLSIYGEKEKAIPHLERAVKNMSPAYREGSYKERSAPREALFALARAYHINEEFDRAIREYERYRDVMIKRNFADIEYVNNQIKSCELAKSMVTHPVNIEFIRMDEAINRFPANYNPVVSYDDTTIIYMTDRQLYHAIMMTSRLPGGGWTEPRVINEELGSDGDCYPTSLTANGRELYLVKKDMYGSDIYISYLKNGKWTRMIPLNRNINTDYSETHACISYNGKMLYFTSNRPGGEGALDIWVSETTVEGDWGEARNLGPKINSHYSEETPFLADLGRKLYFSSQGHATMGGFDYFVAERLPTMTLGSDEESGRRSSAVPFDAGWSFPQNLGYPISTADDDLFYYPRKSGQGAYCSTIIKDISPARSIYTLRSKAEPIQIAARRQDEGERTDAGSLKVSGPSTTSDLAGTSASSAGPPGPSAPESETIPPGETDPDNYYVLNNILFEYDSYELSAEGKEEAERVLEVMQENPAIKLKLTGHTDARGTDEYNLRLSERRAQSVADYLIRKGVQKSRIKVTAAGEIRPIAINRYEDGTDSPEGRRLNRHVSMELENLRTEKIRVADIFVPENLRPKTDQYFTVLLVNSSVMLDTIPDVVAGEQTALIITDSAFLYTAGNFSHKVHAMQYLNEVIDAGYPDAGMLEQRDLERLIARMSEEGISVTASFTIQIMALKTPVGTSHFKPLEGVVMYKGKDGFHRYVYGDFENIQEAIQRLPSIRQMGYDDAFIMSILRYQKLSE
jgi:outer membrane protein OmpA-like peptidoglycan-associated protein